MKCPKCNGELLIDHVVKKDEQEDYYYACINPRCKNYGTAFKPTGETTESTIKTAE